MPRHHSGCIFLPDDYKTVLYHSFFLYLGIFFYEIHLPRPVIYWQQLCRGRSLLELSLHGGRGTNVFVCSLLGTWTAAQPPGREKKSGDTAALPAYTVFRALLVHNKAPCNRCGCRGLLKYLHFWGIMCPFLWHKDIFQFFTATPALCRPKPARPDHNRPIPPILHFQSHAGKSCASRPRRAHYSTFIMRYPTPICV